MTESYTGPITLSLMDRERKSLVGVWAILFVATLSVINFLIDLFHPGSVKPPSVTLVLLRRTFPQKRLFGRIQLLPFSDAQVTGHSICIIKAADNSIKWAHCLRVVELSLVAALAIAPARADERFPLSAHFTMHWQLVICLLSY